MVRQREIRSGKKRKAPKWQKVLTKAERTHLKGVRTLTKKAFTEMNDFHNRRRKEVNAVEPCYTCNGIARKLGLEVHARSKLVEVLKAKTVWISPKPVKTEKPAKLAAISAEKDSFPCHSKPKTEWCDYKGLGGFMGHTCKPKKPEPVAEKFLDLPLIYIIIAASTFVWGLASAVVYLKGW